ncbi:MAG: hypothetical protein OXN16_12685 [Gammaproteobacteria bacterium]|nr:hypothetical protein [Gammaproteobacteria bacterium]
MSKNKINLDEIAKAERDPVTMEELEDAMRTVLKHPPVKTRWATGSLQLRK